MNKFEGISGDPFIDEFLEYWYNNQDDGIFDVQEAISERHAFNEDVLDNLANNVIDFLEEGDWDSSDHDYTHSTETRKGETEIAKGIIAKWEYCHGEYFGNAEAWDSFYPKGKISFITEEDLKKAQDEKAEKFCEKFLKENPGITVEEAVKKVFSQFNHSDD